MLIGFVVAGWQIIAIYRLLLPFAIGFSGGTPTQTLVSRWFVRRRGLAFSIWAMGLVLAGVLLPPSPILALMKETTGSYTLGILLLAAFGLLAIVASFFYRPRRPALA